MVRRGFPVTSLLCVLLSACTSASLQGLSTLTPFPSEIPTPSPTGTLSTSPTPTPTLTPISAPTLPPTPTSIPRQHLTILWPAQVSAIEPVPLEVEVIPPPGVEVTTTLQAVVRHSRAGLIYEAPLLPGPNHLFVAEEPLRLPLNPPMGTYRLIILVQSSLHTAGERVLFFRPEPIPLHDLAPGAEGGVHEGVELAVPLEYEQVFADGGPWAGVRMWRFDEGTVSLWWAPGPTEELLLSNAIVVLEATYSAGGSPQVIDVEQLEWKGQPAFLFHERWPDLAGDPSETLVVQGPDSWLYALRIGAQGGRAIPHILYQVRETLSFAE